MSLVVVVVVVGWENSKNILLETNKTKEKENPKVLHAPFAEKS